MSESLNLELPYLAEAQAQKHVTVNDALRRIDSVVQLSVEDRDRTAPPAAPVEGQRHIVAADPIGAWDGHAQDVAAYVDGAWVFFDPRPGWMAFDEAAEAIVYFNGASWEVLTALGAQETIGKFGVNAIADTENRLVIAADAALFQPDPGSAGGDVQIKVNKTAAGDVASHVFQTGFSGRAEFGLIGSDDFALKVSADGTTFREAFSVARTDATVDFAQVPTIDGSAALGYTLASRAAVRTTRVPADVETITTRGYDAEGDGGEGTYVRVAAASADGLGVTDAAGGFWALAGDTVTARQAGAKGDGTTDDTTALRRALLSGRNVHLGDGEFYITDMLRTGAEYQRIIGAGRGRTVLKIDRTFAMSSIAVIRIAQAYVNIEEITIDFDQSAVTSRATLVKYPPAINLVGQVRIRLQGVRIQRGWDGVVATGNCGGAIFDDVECGTFNVGIEFGGSLDTVELSNTRVWPYGFAGNSTLYEDIYSDGQTIGFRIGQIDDLKMANCTPFRAKIILTDTNGSHPFGTITGLALDGKYSSIEMSAGFISLSSLYATSDAADDTFIKVTGGDLVVSDFVFRGADDQRVPMVLVDGNAATLQAQNGKVNLTNALGDGFVVNRGSCAVSSVRFQLEQDQNRSGACIRQTGGSLSAFGNSATRKRNGSGPFIAVANNADNSIFGNDSNGWGFEFPNVRTEGLYGPNQYGEQAKVDSVLTLGAVDGVNEGGEIQFEGAGGNATVRIDNNAGSLRVFNLGADKSLQVLGADGLAALAGDELSFSHGLKLGRGAANEGASTVVGGQSMNGVTTGNANTAVGQRALSEVRAGSTNVAIGSNAAQTMVNGSGNTMVGHAAGATVLGSSNTGLGRSTFAGAPPAIQNSAAIGDGATVTSSNQVQLGNSATTTFAYGAVQNRSDARDKVDVRETALGLDFVRALRPVDFRWDYREDYARPDEVDDAEWQAPEPGSKARTRLHHGFIAQDVERVIAERGLDFGGYQDHAIAGGLDVKSLGYTELIGPLVKAVQQLAEKVDALQRAG